MIIWEQMYRGMGAAGWVIGFLLIAGLALIAFGTIGWAVLRLLESDFWKEGGERGNERGNVGRHAARVGRDGEGRA